MPHQDTSSGVTLCTVPAGTKVEQLKNGLFIFFPPSEPPFFIEIRPLSVDTAAKVPATLEMLAEIGAD